MIFSRAIVAGLVVAASCSSAGLAEEGFIHCSFAHQVATVATALYRGQTDLVILTIDERGLPVVVEDCYESGDEFPHIYGPIPRAAVVEVRPFPPNPDGTFSFAHP